MLYINVIFKTLIDIFFLKNILLLIVFLLLLISFYLLWINLKANQSKTKFFILFIRFLIFLLFLPILNKKVFKNNSTDSRMQNIGVLVDNSLSMQEILNNNSIDIDTILQILDYWNNKENINLSWYN